MGLHKTGVREELSMVEYVKGNILDSKCSVLVNPVNCVGVMGKGLALQFKEKFPRNFRYYQDKCKDRMVRPGNVLLYREQTNLYIANMATKDHWRYKSLLQWVKDGLYNLKTVMYELGLYSVAIPPVGCGNGGLYWKEVKPLIKKVFADTTITVEVYGRD